MEKQVVVLCSSNQICVEGCMRRIGGDLRVNETGEWGSPSRFSPADQPKEREEKEGSC